jgi:GTP-binding protein
MAFLDHVVLNIKAGKGGDGVVRWRRERAIDMGGPAGGDGGKGGDVYVVGQRNLHTLHHYSQQKDFQAESGSNGGSKNMHGKSGEDLYLYFPLGTEIFIKEYERIIDLTVAVRVVWGMFTLNHQPIEVRRSLQQGKMVSLVLL